MKCPQCSEVRLVVGARENDQYVCKDCDAVSRSDIQLHEVSKQQTVATEGYRFVCDAANRSSERDNMSLQIIRNERSLVGPSHALPTSLLKTGKLKVFIPYDGSESSDTALDDLRRAGLPAGFRHS